MKKTKIILILACVLCFSSITVKAENTTNNSEEVKSKTEVIEITEEDKNEAEKDSDITEEKVIVPLNYDIENEEEDEENKEKQDKKAFTIKKDRKNEMYSSKGTIMSDKDDKGEQFDVENQNIELLTFTTDADNELYVLIDYDKPFDNVVLLGKTTEQELSSLVDNITQREIEAEKEKTEKEKIKKEKLEAEKTKALEEAEAKKKFEFSNIFKQFLPIAGGIVVAVILFFFVKSRKNRV